MTDIRNPVPTHFSISVIMKIDIVDVTPELAQMWLATNTDQNRKISKPTVNRYANDMILGKWLVTGEAIKFNQQGQLMDGQHRLSAVLASRKTVQMCVIRDLNADTMLVIDTGKSRTAGDALTINGHNGHSNNMASLARKIIGHLSGADTVLGGKRIRIANSPITNREIIEFCNDNDLSPHVNFATSIKYKSVTGAMNVGEYGFFHWYFSKVDAAAADQFLTKIATLEDVSADSPIRALLQKLTRSAVVLDGKMKMHAVVTAWNAWRTGQKLTNIHVGRIAADEPVPQPV